MKDMSNYPGYNKLRLDSATSPKHSPRSGPSGAEKVRVSNIRSFCSTSSTAMTSPVGRFAV